MLRFLSDEDFNNHIVRGLLRRLPLLDIVRVQDVGLRGHRDTDILEWAAKEERILLTHDADTMIEFAKKRVAANKLMPGIVEISQDVSIGEAIDELIVFATCSLDGEWEGQVVFLPFYSNRHET